MAKKQQVQVTIFNGSQYGGDGWPPEDPAGFMAWFQARIDEIPPEHMTAAKIEIGTESGYYNDSSADIEITYMRDESDEEAASRERSAARNRQRQIERERQILAALLKKYGAT